MTLGKETGHAKNVSNFDKFVAEILTFGVSYKPSKGIFKIEELSSRLNAGKAALSAVYNAEQALKSAISAREVAFEPFNKLITRVSYAMKASDTAEQFDEKGLSLIRKLQGRRISPKNTQEMAVTPDPNVKEPATISSTHLSYDSRIENFDKLIKLLAGAPSYNPNETDLKVTSLTVYHNDLKARNNAVNAAESTLNQARIVRNDILYKKNVGIVDLTVDIKNYLKSIYGAHSPQLHRICAIRFVNLN